jgi:tetratricopeptide (TPR) repeat protein
MRATWIAAAGLALALVAAGVGAYYYFARAANSDLPSAGSPAYEQTTSSFYRGLAQLQVGLLDDAKREFSKAAALAPGEPAAWANLGLAHLRLGEFDAASGPVARAVALLPGSSDLALLQGRLETSRGQLEPGIAHLRRAVDLDRTGLRARYALAEEIERAGGSGADAEAQQQFDQILQRRPDNLAALLERARLSAKRGDTAALRDSTTRLDRVSVGWPAPAQEQFRALRQAVDAGNSVDAARSVAFLRNVLVRSTVFRESLALVRTPTELIAEPFGRFLRLPPPSPNPSPADQALTFTRGALPGAGTAASVAFAVSLDGAAAPVPVAADDRELRVGAEPARGLPWPGAGAAAVPAANSILAIDWNRDFRMDFVVAGRGGVRLYLQRDGGRFEDATPKAGRIDTDCLGVWAADIDMDGDLDLIVGVRGAAPMVLRNNGDGTWSQMRPFRSVAGVRAFVWADLDGDGDPDAAMVGESGDLHAFENQQGGEFREMSLAGLSGVVALSVGDVNGDGALDLVALDRSGVIRRLSFGTAGLEQQTLANWTDPIDSAGPSTYAIFLADLDNNGAVDLVVSGGGRSRFWLSDEKNTLRPFAAADAPLQDVNVFGVIDLNGDGQLDLVGTAGGQPVVLTGSGTKGYHWAVMRPRAQPTAGDQRINSFGVGGEIEIRSGLLTQKQVLTGAPAHFGLGARTGIDVARIFWPNGIMQADFDRAADQAVLAEQRLKGSCPWVFTYDGAGMRFVTDFLWRSPLGLRINAQDTAGVTQTEDWVRIRGDQLVARDGLYDVRITAELWETHFVDHVSMLVIDHPADQDVFVDERFAREAPALAVRAMTRPRPIARAWDDAGTDVTDLVAKQDGRYLATFARGPYQGVARDHFVEFEVDDVARPIEGREGQWLIANGFIYPTDSSINVAISQAGIEPRGLSLEAQDPSGRWIVVAPDLGFPAGKNKTILVDLSRAARAGVERPKRFRLRTNLEIYWDSLAIAESAGGPAPNMNRLQPARAELRYRGFSKTDYVKHDVPETPRYDQLANVGQRWRDLTGYYTRYGEVGELLASVDDRYVIMNAGDELRLAFQAPPERPKDAKGGRLSRDFVLIGDGWVKDGDYNTSYSKTVLPLPRHQHPDYKAPSADLELEEDPVYRQHARDWQTYHTRFVTPRAFLGGLR